MTRLEQSSVRPHTRSPYILIVGSGFAGLGMAIRLKQAGINDFVVIERAGDVGGTWRDNTYPGAACDVPSHLYSFSFAPNPRWRHSFSRQPEIQSYLQQCADRYGVREHIRFDCPLLSASWDESARRWQVQTGQGEFSADILINAAGALSDPAIPNVPGIESFTGTVFHSARWNHDHDLTGERVAVVGTGASAIQFVPQIQPKVGKLVLFQRTPPWILPRMDRRLTRFERFLYRRFPITQQIARGGIYAYRESAILGFVVDQRLLKAASKLARLHLEKQVPDPALRAKLTPTYAMGCKRVLLASDYYPSLTQPNVEVVPHGIKEVRAHSVVASDGTEHEVDTLIFGTGFQVTDLPIAHQIHGRNAESLAACWNGNAHAYLGSSIAGYPNLFLLVGPNTGLAHNSQVYMIEAQIDFTLDAIKTMRAGGLGTVEVEPDHEQAYTQAVHRRMQRTVWLQGGCNSWYLDATGRNTTLWPGATFRYRSITRTFPVARYRTTPAQPPRVAAVASPTSLLEG